MPFLFVDYDQGAGGEHLCYLLSQTPQCVPLRVEVFGTGRKKVHDLFEQEFLKPVPKPQFLQSHPKLYNVSPSHRHCGTAQNLLGKISTLRIANPPEDSDHWRFLKHNQLKKVLLARQPTPEYFFGELRVLLQRSNNVDWLQHADISMDNATLQMLSKGIDPTEENRQTYLAEHLIQDPEPCFPYDLIVNYHDLLEDHTKVVKQIQEAFGIELDPNQLVSYSTEYETFIKQT